MQEKCSFNLFENQKVYIIYLQISVKNTQMKSPYIILNK